MMTTNKPIGKARRMAIVRHAADIYTNMPGKAPLTDATIKGHRTQMQTAIELAVLFDQTLEEYGYDGSDRIND